MSQSTTAMVDGHDLIFPCPHCGLMIVVACKDLRCRIFRHGTYRQDSEDAPQQLDPHASQQACRQAAGSVYGCTGPFRLVKGADGTWRAEVCGYI